MAYRTLYERLSATLQIKFSKVKLLLTDVDGVLTDGTVLLGEKTEFKRFHVLDGLGLTLLRENGIRLGWISNRPSPATLVRAKQLEIEFVSQEPGNKIFFAEEILRQTGLTWQDTCYMGDDLVDMCIFRRTPLSVAVHNAHPLLRQMASYVSQKSGGHEIGRAHV